MNVAWESLIVYFGKIEGKEGPYSFFDMKWMNQEDCIYFHLTILNTCLMK